MKPDRGLGWAISMISLSLCGACVLTLVGWGIVTGITGDSLVADPFTFGWSVGVLGVLALFLGIAFHPMT